MAKKFDFLSPGIEIREVDQSFLPVERDAEGPIIIGRTRKGPANKPVKIRNLDDFVAVFGAPVPGGTGDQGDMWREGNLTGPTYGAYAAQAWLASEESPITFVRLVGEQHSQATGTKAGWKLSGDLNSAAGSNGTAYGLFLIGSSSTNQDQTGSLAAIFYADTGYLALRGTSHDPAFTTGVGAANHLFKNTGTGAEFSMEIYDSNGTKVEDKVFNFSRNSSKYLRNVFNTNPQLINTTTIPSEDRKTYWLGESFTREVEDLSLHDNAAGETYGILLALESGSFNWSDRNESASPSKTGYVISQQEKGQEELFRFEALHVGEDIQRNYMVAIEEISTPANGNVDAYGTFTVCVKDMSGQTIEKYSNLNLNPASNNYIGKRIGDQFQLWSESDRRYRTYGDFPNQSDIFYVDIKPSVKDGGMQGHIPAGFKGPIRPTGFTIVSGSQATPNAPTNAVYNLDSIKDTVLGDQSPHVFSGSYVKPAGSVPDSNLAMKVGFAHVPGTGSAALNNFTGSFLFPALPLRANGTEGGAPDPFRAYYGIRPKLSSTSNQHDPDYIDYTRRLNADANSFVPATDGSTEHSFIFSLDDIRINTSTNTVVYTSGSYATSSAIFSEASPGGGSFSKENSFSALLDKNVRQFMMPFVGGSEGLDITEKEPFRDGLIDPNSQREETSNYLQYSLFKAIDSCKDPEVVPANLLVVPGIRQPIITNHMISVAEQRKDVLAIIDLENDYLPRAERLAAATENGSLGSVDSAVSSLKTRNLNSSYACAFYPWIQISDNINAGNLVWVPPSVAALGAFGKSQAQSDVWFAPAGFNRGGLGSLGGSRGPSVISARQRLDSSERDKLYEVNINPIASFPAEGLVIFGQKTLQAGTSALDRINVRRLLLYLKSRVAGVARNLLFDNNVPSTWARFESQVNPILSDTKARFGLTDYKLVLDETTTTPDLIDRNIMYAKIFIKPARAIEFIVVDFVITNTGADFV